MVFVNKNVTNRQYLYGDFDRDGAKNVDDPRPFNPRVSVYPTHKQNPSLYHSAQYGDGEREVKLSTELRAVEKYNNQARPQLLGFLQNNSGSSGRIKTVPSTLKKLRERNIHTIHDVAGARVLTTNRQSATKSFSSIKANNRYSKSDTDDYYKNPKGGVHYAYHTYLKPKVKSSPGVEVQVTSKKMYAVQQKMHKSYKKGKSLGGFIPVTRKLFNRGF